MDAAAGKSYVGEVWRTLRTPKKLPMRALSSIAVLITVLHLLPDWMPGYRAETDEGMLLEAGARLDRGEGFVTDKDDPLTDLSNPQGAYLTSWPPMYGLLFFGWLKLTGSVKAALIGMKMVKAAAALSGSMGWLRLANLHLPATGTLIFALGLASTFYGALINPVAGNPTNLIVWAIIPWQMMLLPRVAAGTSWTATIAAGLPTALAVAFRYCAVFLPTTLGLAMLLWSAGSWRTRFARGALLCLMPGIALAAVLTVNSLNSGSAIRPENAGSKLRWRRVLESTPIKFVLGWGFGVEESVTKLKPSWRGLSFPHYLPAYALLAVLLIGSAIAARGFVSNEGIGVIRLAVLGGLCLLGVLTYATISVPASPDMVDWSALDWDRYYSEFAPMVLLAWLIVLTAAAPAVPRWNFATIAPTAVTALACFGFGFHLFRIARNTAYETFELSKTPQPAHAVDAALCELAFASPVRHHVIFDSPTATLKNIRWMPGIRVAHTWIEGRLLKSGTAEPVYVIVPVRREWSIRDGAAVDNWETEQGERFRKFFRLRKVAVVRDHDSESTLFAGIVDPYTDGRPTGDAR